MLKKEDFINKDIPAVDKTIQALKYMQKGLELTIGNNVFMVAETHTEGFKIMIKFGEDEFVGFNGDIDDFSTICNKLTEEDLIIMSATIVLNQINKKER